MSSVSSILANLLAGIADNSHSHPFLQLPLISADDFLAQYPQHANLDENALTVARIDHEHGEREALEQQRQGMLKKKQGLIADNKKRKDDLANLDKDLERFIDVGVYGEMFVCPGYG